MVGCASVDRFTIKLQGAGSLELSAPPLSRRGNLSVQAISWVIEQSKHKGNSFVVLLMIANHARSDGTGAWPSVPTIARESRIAVRTVQRTLKRLARVTRDIQPELLIEEGKGPHGCNLYAIPGVKVSPGGRQIVSKVVPDTVTGVVTPLSHPNRPLTGQNPKKETEPNMISDEQASQRQKRKDQDQLQRLERILSENKNLIPAEQARIQLAIDDLKRKVA